MSQHIPHILDQKYSDFYYKGYYVRIVHHHYSIIYSPCNQVTGICPSPQKTDLLDKNQIKMFIELLLE